MFFLSIFLSFAIFIKYNSSDTDCTDVHPCNYSFALSKIENNEKVYFCDSKIHEEKQLIDFHYFISNISHLSLNQIEFFGNNTYIDGSFFPPMFPSFLSIINVQMHFNNFIFCAFRNSIIYFRNSQNSTLSNIVLDSSHLTDQISAITSSFSMLTISNVTFQHSRQYRSSYFFSSSSQLSFHNCLINNIAMPTASEFFLFMFIDTQVLFHESNFSNLNFIGSSLFLITSYSNLTMIKVNLRNNIFSEMITITYNSYIIINSCKFQENQGRLITSYKGSNISLINTIFESNIATGLELFLFKKSKISINYDCQFLKNIASTIFLLKGKNGFINISYTDFISNYLTDSILTVFSQSKFYLTKCLFKLNNVNKQLILLSNQVNGRLSEISFNEIQSSAFEINRFSSLSCFDLIFNGFPFIDHSLIVVKKSSSLTVDSSQFGIQCINGHLIESKSSSHVHVQNSVFFGSVDETLNDGFNGFVNCTFRKPKNKRSRSFLSFSYLKAFYVLMVSFAVLEVGRLVISCMSYLNEN